LSRLRVLPGLLLAGTVAFAAGLMAELEAALLGRAWIEPMVLAILLGMLVANSVRLPRQIDPGINLSAKTLLDIAVALLGATLSWAAVAALGLPAFLLIAALVTLALVTVYGLGRALALGPRLAMLIAAGNAICGNSAIAAVAPIIGARREEVTAAITLTALIGVIAVLLLPFAVWALGLALPAYAVLVGLSVYAVPQVVAAAAPFGTAVIALATLVKLARVVMLGPLTLVLSFLAPRFADEGSEASGRPRLYLPWFILAFAGFAVLRSTGVIDAELATMLGHASKLLATVAMAALGLQVRVSALREVGPRVALASAGAAIILLLLAGAAALLISA
jgi:uncharacterized integral membrane protein (TIGR00698 family)